MTLHVVRPEIYGHIQRLTARQREHAQHEPRPSRVRYVVRTRGVGESRLENLDLGAFMLEEPSFSMGVIADETLQVGNLPLATATVLRFKRNSGGLYHAADVGFRVDCAKFDVRLRFSLTFEASTLRATHGTGVSGSQTTARGTNTSSPYSGSDWDFTDSE